jgi:hypothetical protein
MGIKAIIAWSIAQLVDKFGLLRTAWNKLCKEHQWQKTKSFLVLENNFYYLHNSTIKDGPFCVHCTDAQHELIRMLKMPMGYVCQKCKLVLTLKGENASKHIADLYRKNLFG